MLQSNCYDRESVAASDLRDLLATEAYLEDALALLPPAMRAPFARRVRALADLARAAAESDGRNLLGHDMHLALRAWRSAR